MSRVTIWNPIALPSRSISKLKDWPGSSNSVITEANCSTASGSGTAFPRATAFITSSARMPAKLFTGGPAITPFTTEPVVVRGHNFEEEATAIRRRAHVRVRPGRKQHTLVRPIENHVETFEHSIAQDARYLLVRQHARSIGRESRDRPVEHIRAQHERRNPSHLDLHLASYRRNRGRVHAFAGKQRRMRL